MFDLRAGSVVTISNVVIRHGRVMSDGGINVLGKLTLINSTVTLNTATGGSAGRIGSVGDTSAVTLIHSTVSNNSAKIFGGGILTQGALTLTDSIVSNNHADSDGGGILSVGDELNITNSIINNNAADFDNDASGEGGGLYTQGTLVMTNSTIRDNDASDGGGIDNDGGTATILFSTISGNKATSAGGIRNHNNGTMKMVNSTVSGNTSNPGGAGGIANNPGTGTLAGTKLQLFNVTIASNSAVGNGGGLNTSATLEIQNSIVGNNTAPSLADCFGTLSSLGYNLIENTTGCTISGTTTGNKTGQDPALAALAANSGDTKTHALNGGSPAIDAGNPAGCVNQSGATQSTDQRNFLRPADGDSNGSTVCDMGAYERLSPGTLTATPTATPTVTLTPTSTRTPTSTLTPTGMINFVGTVWQDPDRDGVREGGEPFLANITMEVWNAAKTQLHDTGLTSATGQYSLFGPPGGLRVHVVLPAGYTFSPRNAGTGTTSSDIYSNGEDFGYSNVISQGSGGVMINAGMYTGVTPTPTVTATASSTSTATPTVTVTDIPFLTQTLTATATATQNPVQSATPTRTRTFTPTATQTQNVGPTATLTRTATVTTTSGCMAKPSKPTLKAPPDSRTLGNQTPKLKWRAAECAASYSVLVKNFATNKKADKAGGLTKLKYKTKTLAPATKFKWIVKACNTFGCIKSAKRTFTTAR